MPNFKALGYKYKLLTLLKDRWVYIDAFKTKEQAERALAGATRRNRLLGRQFKLEKL